MPFPFTFRLSVPGLSNPFSSARPAEVSPTAADPDGFDRKSGNRPGMQKITRRRPSPVLNSPPKAPLSKKRGWEPTFAEPSRSTTTLACTSGYLDTPAKYREMARNQPDDYHEIEMIASDAEMPPPAKRRRGLAGTIVSTALSAALIGTAVGLTVYRLWRDRGKDHELPPPPPYQQGEWNPPQISPPVQVTPPTPRSRKTRQPIASTSKRPISHRRTRTRTHVPHTPPPATISTLFPPTQPEFDFGQEEAESIVVEDQMDWIGDKLSMLIEEGKKALSREVVVMSDAKEDEVDDGSGAWEEDENLTNARPSSVSRSSSIKRAKRPRSIAPTSSYTPYAPSASPRKNGFDLPTSTSSMTITPRRTHSRGISVESGLNMTPSTSFREDERTWESPELKESMEKARARLLRNRGT